MIASLFLCVALLGPSSPDGTPQTPDAPDARLQQATAALDELRLEEAVTLLEEIVADPDTPDRVRGEAWLSLGLARASLLDDTAARAAFAAALTIDPRLEPPPGTSPKVQELFGSTRATLMPNGLPPPRKSAPPDAANDDRPAPPARTTSRAERAAPRPVVPASADRTPWLVGGGVLVGASTLAGGAALFADASLADPAPLRTRAEYETTRSLGIAAFASSVVLAAAGALVIVGSLSSDDGAP